jgi:hypothetical protein
MDSPGEADGAVPEGHPQPAAEEPPSAGDRLAPPGTLEGNLLGDPERPEEIVRVGVGNSPVGSGESNPVIPDPVFGFLDGDPERSLELLAEFNRLINTLY